MSIERIEASFQEEGLLAGIRLHREYGEDSLVLSAPPSSSISSSSINSWTIVWHSALMDKETFSYSNTNHGYSLFRLGIKAMVILGRSERMKYILLTQDRCEIVASENMRYSKSLVFESLALSSLSDLSISTGPSGDKGVKFSVVQSCGKNIEGADLGYSFFLHNLKGIVMPGWPDRKEKQGHIPEKNAEKRKIYRNMKTYGGYSFITSACRLGWLPVRGWKDRFDPRAASLDGLAMAEKYGTYPDSCSDCILSCDRRKKDGKPLPKWKELMTLGTNLGFFDPLDIEKIVSLVKEEGLDPSVTGALISSIELGGKDKCDKYGLKATLDGVLAFINKLASGSLLYNGLKDLEGAVECKDHRAIDFDLRGSSAMALSYSLSLGLLLPSTLIFPKKRPDERAVAIISFHEALYSLALISLGHPPFCSDITYFSKAPEIVYQYPFFARSFSRRFKAFGYNSLDLLEIGMEVMEELSLGWSPLPSNFTLSARSAVSIDTVPLKRLQDYWDEEKVRVSILLKSKREKRVNDPSSKMANVGPREDLGREEDPGLR